MLGGILEVLFDVIFRGVLGRLVRVIGSVIRWFTHLGKISFIELYQDGKNDTMGGTGLFVLIVILAYYFFGT